MAQSALSTRAKKNLSSGNKKLSETLGYSKGGMVKKSSYSKGGYIQHD
jgi:hypothetical protein